MASSRKLIAEFIGVFLIGALAGGLITWCVTDTHLTNFMSRTNNPDVLEARMNKKYAQDYQLSPDEVARIQPLVHQMAQDIYKVRHQFGADITSTLRNYHEQIAAQLNPGHRAIYEAKMAKHDNEVSALLELDQNSPSSAQKE
jgi:uncharacterized membrane protein